MSNRADSAAWQSRVDRGELLAAHRRADGTLLVEGFAAREGILEYRVGNGVRRELVRADTLAKAAAGLGRAPVTLGHPDPVVYPNGVTPDNVQRLGVGDTGGEVVLADGGFVKVQLAVRRRDALDAIAQGTQELSPGYDVLLDETPGVDPVHGRYDAVQTERRYNHLAIVDRARGGDAIRLRADSGVATSVIGGGTRAERPRGGSVNPKFVGLLALCGVADFRGDSDDAALDAVSAALRSRADGDKARADAAQAESKRALDAMTAERDAQKARADAAEGEVKQLKDADKARADAAERADLDGVAKGLGLDPAKHADGKALKRAIAAKHLGSELKSDASDAYVDVLVDLAKAKAPEQRGDGREAGRAALQGTGETRQDVQDGQRDLKPYLSPSERQREAAKKAFAAARSPTA